MPKPMLRLATLVTLVLAVAALPVSARPSAPARGLAAALRARGVTGPGAGATRVGPLVSAPDGAGGLVLAWVDTRDGTADIYALRVTNTGTPASGWPASGVAVCAAPGQQVMPVVVPYAGGAIIAWEDHRASLVQTDHYAQRLSGAGTVLWTVDGVRFATGAQTFPAVAGDGLGGLVAAWPAPGASGIDVFATALDDNGVFPSGWSASGVVVCDAAGDQRDVCVVGRGSLMYVTWVDPRASAFLTHVYGQCLGVGGGPLLAANGVQLDAGSGGVMANALCHDGLLNHGAIAVWSDFTGVSAQRFDYLGNRPWGASGVTLATTAGTLATELLVTRDAQDDGAFVAWQAIGAASTITAQHVNTAGTRLWPAAGATVVTAGGSNPPQLGAIVPDSSRGAFFAWIDPRGGADLDVYAQRVNAAGAIHWATNGIPVCTVAGSPSDLCAGGDLSSGMVMAWSDPREGTLDLYGQRLDSTGVAKWAANGTSLHSDPGAQWSAGVVSDGAAIGGSGAWILWEEKRGTQIDLRMEHASYFGGPVAGGDVCNAPGLQSDPVAVSDGAGGFVVAWLDHRGSTVDVYAQRIASTGAALWTANGVALCTAAGDQSQLGIVADGTGGAIVSWLDPRAPGNLDVYAQRVAGTGAVKWAADGVAVCANTSQQFEPVLASDGSGGAIAAWLDSRSGTTTELYAQRIDSTGAAQWATEGVLLGGATDLGLAVGAVPDGSHGAIVLFDRMTNDPVTGQVASDLLGVQRVDATGASTWGASGTTVCDAGALAWESSLVPDGSGGAFVAWADGRGGPFDVYAQRVSSAGTVQWTANGVAVCNAPGWQDLGQIDADGAGGVLLSWADARTGGAPRAYAQRLDGAGAAQWAANGIVLSSLVHSQYGLMLAADGAGGAAVAWTDGIYLPEERVVFEQHVFGTGALSISTGMVGVTASLVSAAASEGRVRIEWSVAATAPVTIERRTADSDWAPLARQDPDGLGRVRLEDDAVVAGTRYGYRLTVLDAGVTSHAGEVWVEVPLAPLALALAAPRPNPVQGALELSLSLPADAPARVELYDVAGRLVQSVALADASAGRHTVRLDGVRPRAGLYLVRLVQGARAVTTRAVFVR